MKKIQLILKTLHTTLYITTTVMFTYTYYYRYTYIYINLKYSHLTKNSWITCRITKSGKNAFRWTSKAYPHSTSWFVPSAFRVLKYLLEMNLNKANIMYLPGPFQSWFLSKSLHTLLNSTGPPRGFGPKKSCHGLFCHYPSVTVSLGLQKEVYLPQ